jgi:hypothetical protein
MAVNTNKYKLYNYDRPEMWNVPIDMRYEMDGLTEEFGYDMLYVRNCKFVKCKCFDDLHKSGNAKCPLCHGFGYLSSIELIKAFESSTKPYMWDNFINKSKIGVTDQKNEVIYVRQFYNPKDRDFILKVTWDKYHTPVDILHVYEIVGVYEMRGDQGRIELNGCSINDMTDLVEPFQKTLRAMPKAAVHNLLKGGKYIWPMSLMKN